MTRRELVRALLLTGFAIASTACGRENVRPEPVAAQCAAVCYVPCSTSDIRWTASPDSAEAWDALGNEVVQPLAQRVAECSRTNQRACHLCLWRLQEAGVLIGVPPLPKIPADKPP